MREFATKHRRQLRWTGWGIACLGGVFLTLFVWLGALRPSMILGQGTGGGGGCTVTAQYSHGPDPSPGALCHETVWGVTAVPGPPTLQAECKLTDTIYT